jgi:hypothetical protein
MLSALNPILIQTPIDNVTVNMQTKLSKIHFDGYLTKSNNEEMIKEALREIRQIQSSPIWQATVHVN